MKICTYKYFFKKNPDCPIEFITNKTFFLSREFIIDHGVIIPRPETEYLTEIAINTLRKLKLNNPVIIDVGTGSGVIIISLKKEFPNAIAYAVDISIKSLKIAFYNSILHKTFINFFRCDITKEINKLPKNVNVLISNPPYVLGWEWVSQEVLKFEPFIAIYGNTSVLAIYKSILKYAKKSIKKGFIILETNPSFIFHVKKMCSNFFKSNEITIINDLRELPRYLLVIKE